MITLTAKIDLLSGNNEAISVSSSNLSRNNISSDLGAIKGTFKKGKNPFIIGASKIGDGSAMLSSVDYFIGNQLSDENGNFAQPYNIIVTSTQALNSITLRFDTQNNRHPNRILLTPSNFYKTIYRSEGEEYQGGIPYKYVYYDGVVEMDEPSSFKILSVYSSVWATLPNGYYSTQIQYADGALRFRVRVPYTSQWNDVNGYYVEIVTSKDKAKEVIDDDAIFTIPKLGGVHGLNILIDNWNAPKYPLVLMGIYEPITIEVGRKNSLAIERTIIDRGDMKLPEYGIISNVGNIEFNDTDGEIADYAGQNLLNSGLFCEIRLNNTLVNGASQVIAQMETDQWNYDNDNRVVSVSLKDDLEEWQDINVAEISYDPRTPEAKPFSLLYEHLWKLTNKNYNMLSLKKLDEETIYILENTYMQYYLLEEGTLWQQWTKLCEACQFHIYKDSKGVIVCKYNGGN